MAETTRDLTYQASFLIDSGSVSDRIGRPVNVVSDTRAAAAALFDRQPSTTKSPLDFIDPKREQLVKLLLVQLTLPYQLTVVSALLLMVTNFRATKMQINSCNGSRVKLRTTKPWFALLLNLGSQENDPRYGFVAGVAKALRTLLISTVTIVVVLEIASMSTDWVTIPTAQMLIPSLLFRACFQERLYPRILLIVWSSKVP